MRRLLNRVAMEMHKRCARMHKHCAALLEILKIGFWRMREKRGRGIGGVAALGERLLVPPPGGDRMCHKAGLWSFKVPGSSAFEFLAVEPGVDSGKALTASDAPAVCCADDVKIDKDAAGWDKGFWLANPVPKIVKGGVVGLDAETVPETHDGFFVAYIFDNQPAF
jgi:hypothetical protein